MDKFTLGVIGYGNMATAILNGILDAKVLLAENIIVSDLDDKKLNNAKNLGINFTKDNNFLVNNCTYILWAVKPQMFKQITKEIHNTSNAKCILTIMAGIKSDMVKEQLGGKVEVIRIMPNTPCFVKKGMVGLTFDNAPNIEYQNFALNIFNSVGKTIVVSENNMDNVSSISGSGPAYSYMFINALIKSGENIGLDYNTSKVLALNTLLGSIEMLKNVNSTDEIEKYIDVVCSKGGSTIEAVNHMRENNFDEIISSAIKKCKKRNIELSKND